MAHGDYVFYRYDPSLVAASVFTVLFFLFAGLHTFQIIKTRTWYFIPLLVGALMEAIGYIGRIQSHYHPLTLGPFILQSVLLLVAPALLAASIYMILGRIIHLVDAEHHSPIPIKWLTKTFVTGDVLSFLMQSGGAGLMSSKKPKSVDLGQKVIVGGLFVQVLFFVMFLVVALVFNKRIRREPTVNASTLQQDGKTGWMTLLRVLYTASAFILIRSLFRVIEYIQGNAGYLLRNEVWLYIFDSCLMLAVVVMFNVIHPSGAVPGKGGRGKENGRELYDLESTHGPKGSEDAMNQR
ncbi:RTA1-domain-containing protein [Wilcoxina mikolae CBS 423.85]|nr:RTA1-domain-containing protein [Wilcoxina mikolae CBS 423.85]